MKLQLPQMSMFDMRWSQVTFCMSSISHSNKPLCRMTASPLGFRNKVEIFPNGLVL